MYTRVIGGLSPLPSPDTGKHENAPAGFLESCGGVGLLDHLGGARE